MYNNTLLDIPAKGNCGSISLALDITGVTENLL
jgi:hypothetical protein